MNINFRKLLPSILRNTRWAQLIEAFQEVVEDIKSNKIDVLKNQYLVENMSNADIIKMIRELGYNVQNFEGYTNSQEYLLRQLYTVIPRVEYKNVEKGYEFLDFIYNLSSNIYPLYYEEERLKPIYNWKNMVESLDEQYTLDRDGNNALVVYDDYLNDWMLDSGAFGVDNQTTLDRDLIYLFQGNINDGLSLFYLDTEEFPNLDMTYIMNMITRHFLYSYKFDFIEEKDVFINSRTSRALHYDLLRQKRRTEVPYFEPYLEFNTEMSTGNISTGDISTGDISTGHVTKETYYTWNKEESTDIMSRAYPYISSGEPGSGNIIKYDMSSAHVIKFGKGSWGEQHISTGQIMGVNEYQFEMYLSSGDLSSGENGSGILASGDIHIADALIYTENELEIRKWIFQKNKDLKQFSEIAVLDRSSGCLYYAEFPMVNYYSGMYNNVALKINLI